MQKSTSFDKNAAKEEPSPLQGSTQGWGYPPPLELDILQKLYYKGSV